MATAGAAKGPVWHPPPGQALAFYYFDLSLVLLEFTLTPPCVSHILLSTFSKL